MTGAVVKVSSDGQSAEFIGTDLRNPNGMGVGGPKDWITVADNPSGKAVYNGFFMAKRSKIRLSKIADGSNAREASSLS